MSDDKPPEFAIAALLRVVEGIADAATVRVLTTTPGDPAPLHVVRSAADRREDERHPGRAFYRPPAKE